VFVSTRDGDYALFTVDAGGRHEWRVTKEKGDPATPTGLFFELQPAWSPDGGSIAFVSKRTGHFHVYVVAADGSALRQLTTGAADDTGPAWSPDGRLIAFVRGGELWTIAAGGGTARHVGHGIGGDAGGPAWSPDGKLIAYDDGQPGIREIWVARRDGSGVGPITRLRRISSHPTWSPHGDRIAFQSNTGTANTEIYSVGIDGKGLRRLTTSRSDTIDPAWSRNGTLAFSRDGAIWTLTPSGHIDQLTSAGNDAAPAWHP
jgi:Tol biopolymer transport system component